MSTTMVRSRSLTRLDSDSISQFAAYLVDRGYSSETVRAYRTDLSSLMEDMVGALEHHHVEQVGLAWLNLYRRQRSPKTILRRITSLRAYCRWAQLPDYFKEYRAPTPRPTEPHPLAEGQEGVRLMCEAARTPFQAALFALCGYCGLRVGEAISLTVRDVSLQRRVVTVRGKGDKTRTVPISTRGWSYIEPGYYLALSDSSRGGRLVPIPERTARENVGRAGMRALGHWVPSHDLRATFATELYKATLDIRLVQELLGHADPTTTVAYTLIDEESKKKAVELL